MAEVAAVDRMRHSEIIKDLLELLLEPRQGVSGKVYVEIEAGCVMK